MIKLIHAILLVFSVSAMAESTVDKTELLNGVSLKSAKQKDVRTYSGETEKLMPFPIDLVKKGVTNFTEKCNNDYKDKREFTSKEKNCKYHNEHLVETFMVSDFRKMDYFKSFSEVYILGKRVYNRGSFGYYELVTVSQSQNEKNQKTITVVLRMLDDKEVKVFMSPKIKKESAFDSSSSVFTLTEVASNQTLLRFEYNAETDHWLLNKEVSVPQVFASISNSVNQLIKTVETESSIQKRALASKK